MNCDEASMLLHALIDGELDAGHARELEIHISTCAGCAARLREFHELRKMMTPAGLGRSGAAGMAARVGRRRSRIPLAGALSSRAARLALPCLRWRHPACW